MLLRFSGGKIYNVLPQMFTTYYGSYFRGAMSTLRVNRNCNIMPGLTFAVFACGINQTLNITVELSVIGNPENCTVTIKKIICYHNQNIGLLYDFFLWISNHLKQKNLNKYQLIYVRKRILKIRVRHWILDKRIAFFLTGPFGLNTWSLGVPHGFYFFNLLHHRKLDEIFTQ